MGNIIRKVEISSLDNEGNAGRPRRYKALVDTGATITVISKRILEETKSKVLENYPARISGRDYPTALVALRLDGENCSETPLVVAVSDAYARKARPEAEMILGHDYLQREQSVLAYDGSPKVRCAPKKRSRK